MNDSLSNQQELTPEDERLLDLLVDGELDDTRRRQLLLTFEEKPSGWRTRRRSPSSLATRVVE